MKQPINEIKKMQLIAGLINEVEYNESLWGINKLPLTEAKEAKKKILHIDVANPYEYRHGLAYELDQIGEYTDEALEKSKVKVLKNLAKDVNYYTTLLNQKQSPYKFKAPETDKEGYQARPDGHMKKEAKKDEKANVKNNLGKKEAGKAKPKGVKIMSDKGVTGSEKTIKEGFKSGDKAMLDGEEVEITRVSDDGRVYVRRKEDSAILGKMPEKWVKPEDLKTVEGIEEAKKDEKANVKNNLGKKEAGKAKPKGVKIMSDKGVEGKEKTIKESVEEGKNIQNRADEINSFAKLVKSKNYDEIFPQYDSITSSPDKWSITPNEANQILKKYFDDNDWDKFEEYSNQDIDSHMEEGSFMGGVDLGSSFDKMKSGMNTEDEFNQLMSKYDWYYEMSDDPRTYDRGVALDRQLRTLGKQIGANKAVDMFNSKAPSDRKVTSSFFMEGKEDKHAKLKETLKAKLKELINPKDIQAAKSTGDVVNIPSQDTAAQTAAKNAKINFRTYK